VRGWTRLSRWCALPVIAGWMLSCGTVQAQSAPRVVADGETVDGEWIAPPRLAVFRGIPYAAPPVGDLRWRPPQRHAPDPGVRNATRFGHACMQPRMFNGATRSGREIDDSEDCLTINVWSPNMARDGAPLPVLFWIHGGSNIAGSSAQPWYDGTKLAQRGLVVVSINYRVGVFGFLAHPALAAESRAGASGNYALLDILAALQWVQRNIGEFGGDSSRVTVYGQSAGANNIVHLMASPLSKGLFHRAIPQSGAPMDGLSSQSNAMKIGALFGMAIGALPFGDQLKALREVPAADVIQAQSVFLNSGIFGPIVDGLVLKNMTARVFDDGKQQPVPMLFGSTALEMSTLRGAMPAFARTVAGYRGWIDDTFGKGRDSLLKLYPASTDADVDLAARQLVTDFYFTCQTRMTARAMAKVNTPAYLYLFTRVPPGEESLGAYHAADIEYIFNASVPPPKRESVDSTLSDMMVGYWVRFAQTGNPNGPGLPEWPAFSAVTDAYQELGPAVGTRSGLGRNVCGLMEPVLRRLWKTRE
jgi:para-nitrobenzyl esterase